MSFYKALMELLTFKLWQNASFYMNKLINYYLMLGEKPYTCQWPECNNQFAR